MILTLVTNSVPAFNNSPSPPSNSDLLSTDKYGPAMFTLKSCDERPTRTLKTCHNVDQSQLRVQFKSNGQE